ncbi:MAG: ATP-grasp domain-containing protein [Verrucomicrobiota bacterium]|jgi:carbamoyl-phosphate synthase large subunit|nr:ATP-grasp domain-containing protein [Verrucomicrobiota bacterium]
MSSLPANRDQYTILVTGVGAIIGQGIIKSLRQCRENIRVVGVDRDPGCLGPHLCDSFHAKPACDESSRGYLEFWRHLLIDESVDLVLPGLEVDLFFLNANREPLSDVGATLGLNAAGFIDLARDKWQMGQEVTKIGLLSIPSLQSQDWGECIEKLGSPPLLIKPRQGSGSRGIARIFDELDLLYWAKKIRGDFMVQKIVGSCNEEYTVGAFGLGDGSTLSPIIFRRCLSTAGNTQYAEVITDESIVAAIEKLCAYFKPAGPTNYQFRKENELAYLLEINPRLSSSSSLRAAFGYNEAQMSVDYFLRGIHPNQPEILSGRAWRYAEDFVLK